jgi:hypothetical protein
MLVRSGQEVTVTGPDGESHSGRVLEVYRSIGGIVSLWIDLCGDDAANPANRAAGDWISPILVLTQRDGEYRDLWLAPWQVKVLKG